jgi:hypothetical protein
MFTVADGPKYERGKGRINDIFEEDVGDILGMHNACLQHRKPSLHEKDEGGCRQRGRKRETIRTH